MMRSLLRGLWWNRHVRRWVIAVVFLAQAAGAAIKAYEPILTPVYTFEGNLGTCEWRADNQLRIRDGYSPTPRFLYDPQQDHLIPDRQESSFYTLINPISRVFPPRMMWNDWPVLNGGLVTSPDGRYVVYSLKLPSEVDYPYTPLVIVDTKIATSIVIKSLSSSPYTVNIQWGLNSNAFVVTEQGSYGGDPIFHFVSGFEGGLDHVQVKRIEDPDTEAPHWSLYQAFDIDSTGRYLLAQGYDTKPGFQPTMIHLMIIDTQDLSYVHVAEAKLFFAARFEQPGDQRVFYVDVDSAFAYDRQTQIAEDLNQSIETLNIKDSFQFGRGCFATISPDGRFLAFQNDETRDLIVLPIKSP